MTQSGKNLESKESSLAEFAVLVVLTKLSGCARQVVRADSSIPKMLLKPSQNPTIFCKVEGRRRTDISKLRYQTQKEGNESNLRGTDLYVGLIFRGVCSRKAATL